MYVCMYVSMYVSDWLQLQSSLGNSVNVSHGIVNQNYVVRSFRRYVLCILHSSIFQLCHKLNLRFQDTYVCTCPSNILACRLYYTISAAHCGREPRGPGKGQGESHGPRAGEKEPFPPQPMYSGPRAFPLAVPWTPWLSATVRCAYCILKSA